MQYRREIDGLRSIAVMPVLLFHGGFEVFSGGYIGVDIFFVISGYLISTIVLEAHERKSFSLVEFYENRARRILPALVFVCLVSLVPALYLMVPYQFRDFSQSLIAVGLFASNFLFWSETDYFLPDAENKPLLHTWSLAVEEQFYLIFPLVLILLWRFGRQSLFWLFFVIGFASLALAEYAVRVAPTASFFLLPTRIWELLIGTYCAYRLSYTLVKPNNFLALTGLLLIACSVFLFDKSTPVPSLWLLLPVGGTALIILYADSKSGIVGPLLSKPVFVGVGLISYSLYLWHQPILAYARLASGSPPSAIFVLAMLALCFILAYLTWRLVEQPFRRRKGAPSVLLRTRVALFAGVFVSLFALIGSGLWGLNSSVIYDRMPTKAKMLVDWQENNSGPKMPRACRLNTDLAIPKMPVAECVLKPNRKINAVMFGDSHVGALALSMNLEAYAPYNVEFIYYAGCAPVSGIRQTRLGVNHLCNDFNVAVREHMEGSNIRVAILVARWGAYLHGTPFDNQEGGVELSSDFPADTLEGKSADLFRSGATRKERLLARYVSEIQHLLRKGYYLILVDPIPEAGWNVPNRAIRLAAQSDLDEAKLSTSFDAYIARNAQVLAAFDTIKSPRLIRVKPQNILCTAKPGGRCKTFEGGVPLYRDDDHLSDEGARLILPKILEALNSIDEPSLHAQ